MDKPKKSKKADKQSTPSSSLSLAMKVEDEDEDEEYFDALEFVDESSTGRKSDRSSSGFTQKENRSSSSGGTSDDAGAGICEDGNGDVDVDTATAAGVPQVVGNKYYIEEIVNYRVTVDRGRAMERFQAKWYNWPPETNTWEPHSHVDHCHNMIVRFFKANPRKYQLYLQYGDTIETAYPRIRIPGQDSSYPMSMAELKETESEAIAKKLASRRKMIDNRDHLYDENSDKFIPVAVESEIKDQKIKRIQGHYRSPELTAYLIRLSGHHVHKSIWVKDIDTEDLSGFYEKLKLYHKRIYKEMVTPSC